MLMREAIKKPSLVDIVCIMDIECHSPVSLYFEIVYASSLITVVDYHITQVSECFVGCTMVSIPVNIYSVKSVASDQTQ